MIILKPWNGHRVGAVVGVEEPLRERLIEAGVFLRVGTKAQAEEGSAAVVGGSTKPKRKPM